MSASDDLLAQARFVRLLVRDLVRDEHEAADVAQEVALAELRRPSTLTGSRAAWLTAVARRIARKFHRDRSRRRRREEVAARAEGTESVADTTARFDLHRALVEAVHRLPAGQRTAILMRYFEDLRPKEIARRLDVPVATVKTRLQRGLARLRGDLDRKHGAWVAVALSWPAAAPRPAAGLLTGGIMASATAKAALVVGALVVAGAVLAIGVASRTAGRAGERAPRASERAAGAATSVADASEQQAAAASRLPPPVDLAACDRDLDLHGVVVRRDGAPVPGARVETRTYPWRRVHAATWDKENVFTTGTRTTTAADGTFAVRLAWGESVALRATAEGFAPRSIPQVAAGERVRVVLDEGIALEVSLRVAGRPLAGAAVRVAELAGRQAYPIVYGEARLEQTDETGAVRFDGLTPGADVVVQPLVAPRVYRVRLPDRGTKSVELDLPPARTFEGRVTDAQTRLPVAGARVGLTRNRAASVSTDRQGRYRITLHADGWWEGLTVTAAGYAPAHDELGGDFALEPEARAAGRLVDTEGSPARGARVVAAKEPDIGVATVSDEEGRFELGGLVAGAWHTLVVTKKGHARTLVDFQPGELGTLVLGAPGVVEGRVVDDAGEPIPRIAVRLEGGGYGRSRLAERAVRGGGNLGAFEVRITDDLGRFRFPDQPEGMHRLTAIAADGATATQLVQVDRVTRHARTELRFASTGSYLVSVRDERGVAVPGVHVWISPWAGGKAVRGRTDARGEARLALEGRASFVGLRPVSPYLPVDSRRVEEGERAFEFVLYEGAVVSGRVLLDGEPIEGRWVVTATSGEQVHRAPVVSGTFSVLVPRDVPVDLALDDTTRRLAGTKERERTVHRFVAAAARGIEPGTTGVVLHAKRIPTDRTLRVRVVSPAGQPVGGVRVAVDPVPEERPDGVETDAGGIAAFAGLGARATTLTVKPDDDWLFARRWAPPAPREVVPAGQVVELSMREAAELHGVVTGFPEDCSVHLMKDGRRLHGARPDAEGRFVVLVPRDDPGPFEARIVYRKETGMYWAQVARVVDVRGPLRIAKEE